MVAFGGYIFFFIPEDVVGETEKDVPPKSYHEGGGQILVTFTPESKFWHIFPRRCEGSRTVSFLPKRCAKILVRGQKLLIFAHHPRGGFWGVHLFFTQEAVVVET